MARCLLGALLDGFVTMSQFFVSETGQLRREGRVTVGQFRDLVRIVLGNHRLDRFGASVGGLLTHQGGARAKGETGEAPERGHGSRAHLMLGQQLIEARQVHRFLGGQLGKSSTCRTITQNGSLAAINVDGREFTGLVDTQDLSQARRCGAAPGSGGNRVHLLVRSRNAAKTLRVANTTDPSAFQPAIDSPAKTHGA